MIKIFPGNLSGSGSSTRSASVGVIWPLANLIVLLMGCRDQGHELVRQHRSGPLIEYLLTRRQKLGKGGPD
jgi:hypothetical protein